MNTFQKTVPVMIRHQIINYKLYDLYDVQIIAFIIDLTLRARSLHWRHNEQDSISNHRRLDCLLNHLFKHKSKTTSKLFRVTGLCEENSPVTGGFPLQRGSNMENVYLASKSITGEIIPSNGRPLCPNLHQYHFRRKQSLLRRLVTKQIPTLCSTYSSGCLLHMSIQNILI